MTITLNHTIVPVRDKEAAARFFAHLFGLNFTGSSGRFAPMRVNETLTLDFADEVEAFESHHYAFHVSDAEFNAILQRVQAAGLPFGSTPGASTTRSSTTGTAAGASTLRIATATFSSS